MKKLISVFFVLILALTMCIPVFAAPAGNKTGNKTVTELPDSVGIPVVLNADVTPGYKCPVRDGKAAVKGPDFTAEADSVPSGAVRLVVVPITDEESLEWFSKCVGKHWNVTGTVYAVFFQDSNGNRMDAADVLMTVPVPNGYDRLNVYSVNIDGSSSAIDYMSAGTSVSFRTDGSLYYGVVRKQGLIEEETVVGTGAPKITLDMTSEEVADAVLSKKETEYLDDGIDILIKLTVEDITNSVSASDKYAVESAANGFTVSQYLDIELLKQVGDRTPENIYETNKPVRIKLEIPENLLGDPNREIAIMRVHNGRALFLADLDSDPQTFTFETSTFSTFAILYRDSGSASSDSTVSSTTGSQNSESISSADNQNSKSTATGSQNSKSSVVDNQNDESPLTGDETNILLYILLAVAVLAVSVVFSTLKKKGNSSVI